MPLQPLENLVRTRQLKAEPPHPLEIEGLVRSGLARLEDSRRRSLSLESRFDLAYNGAHALALAAMRWHGYRPSARYVVFQCLQHTVGLPAEAWRVLDQAHNRRNLAEYEGVVDVDQALLAAVIRVATEVAARVAKLGPPLQGPSARSFE